MHGQNMYATGRQTWVGSAPRLFAQQLSFLLRHTVNLVALHIYMSVALVTKAKSYKTTAPAAASDETLQRNVWSLAVAWHIHGFEQLLGTEPKSCGYSSK